MATSPTDGAEEHSQYEWLADDGVLPRGVECLQQLNQQRRDRNAAEGRRLAVWRSWIVQSALVLIGALLGTIADAALTGSWDRFDLRLMIFATVGVLPPAAVYWKLIQHHAEAVLLTSPISRELELEFLRRDPRIWAARWAFVVTLLSATVGAATESRFQESSYAVVIGCELLLLAPYWGWRLRNHWKAQAEQN